MNNVCGRILDSSLLHVSQFAMVEVMVTSLMDQFHQPLMKLFRRKELLVLAVCAAAFLLGIPCVMQVVFH